MSFDLAIVIAGFILAFTAVGVLVWLGSRRRAAREEELRAAAATRGWQFESTVERGFRVQRWTGTTEAVSWRAESRRLQAAGANRQRQRRHITRWHGDFSPGITGPILCMGVPKGQEIPAFSVAQGESVIAKLAQKAAGFAFDKAVDVYFGDALGKDVDAAAMHRVEATLPGFIVMAADPDEGARLLSQGLERALLAAVDDHASVLGEQDRPWILLRPHGISLARMERLRDSHEVDRFVRAGVGLSRAFTFGRRSPS